MTSLDTALAACQDWPVPHAAAAVVSAEGEVVGTAGDVDREFPLASVTKILSAYATLIAVENGDLALTGPAGPPGSTVEHLLAHVSGVSFADATLIQGAVGERRIYSNAGFDVLAEAVAEKVGLPFARHWKQVVCEPLRMAHTTLRGGAGAGGVSTVADLTRLAAELQSPTLLSAGLLARATVVAFPGRSGVLPGFGRQSPNDWGLGLEIRDGKSPHWTGANSSPDTFGHFGGSGTFLWVDPDAALACVVLTDRDFGPWAIEAWPAFTDDVLRAAAGS